MDVTEAWTFLANRVLTSGQPHESRNGPTLELIGESVVITEPYKPLLANRRRNISSTYAAAELLWYLTGQGELSQIAAYAPQYKRFAEDDGTLYGAYGPRMLDQLKSAIERLRGDPNTRQAVAAVWRPSDVMMRARDIPCTLSIQLLIRSSILHTIVTMRSNDLWLGTPYDMFCFSCLHMIAAEMLNVGIGTYTHQVGSMHAYKKDLAKVDEALMSGNFDWQHLTSWRYSPISWRDIEIATYLEAAYRVGITTETEILNNQLLHDCVQACRARFTATPLSWHTVGIREQSDACRRRD